MTDSVVSRPSFGLVIGQAARKIKKLHRNALAESGTDFPSWMLFTLLNEKAAAVPVEDVVAGLDHRMDLDEPGVVAVLERAAAAGFVSYEAASPVPTVELTEAGSTYFANTYAHARKATDAAADGVDSQMLETAIDVLLEVDDKATSLLGQ